MKIFYFYKYFEKYIFSYFSQIFIKIKNIFSKIIQYFMTFVKCITKYPLNR